VFHVKRELDEGAKRLGLALDDAQLEKLLAYHGLLATRGMEIGAVAKGDRERLLERHVLDSLRAAPEIQDRDRIGYDFGSGAGLPGIPLSIARPGCGFVLVESRHWRAAFLELVVAELDLNARVERARVETMGVLADLAVSRAFAPLGKTWALARPLLKPDGRLIFYAGRGLSDDEIRGADPEAAPDAVRLVPDVLDRGGPLVIMSRSG
jgi:16S rRNA (guanine527-N7)-methyltransferase